MEETPQHDENETNPPSGQGDEGKERDLQFDPQEIESDPSRNPPIDELNDLKGG